MPRVREKVWSTPGPPFREKLLSKHFHGRDRNSGDDSDDYNSDREDTHMSDHSEGKDNEVPGKDETEIRLEKLLFGDDEGFHEALRSYGERQMMDLSLENHDDHDSGSERDQKEGVEQQVEHYADADV